MNGLKVNTWQEWEGICKFLGQELLRRKFKIDALFVEYGGQGQKQHGIDLIPNKLLTPSIVIQCKHTSRSLEWNTILGEVKKTDDYKYKIDYYYIFTTGSKHTSTCANLAKGYFHTRPNGDRFKVHVIYWDDIDFKQIPKIIIKNYYPHLYSQDTYANSLKCLREVIPTFINQHNLEWLESWNFYSGFVYEKDYEPFWILQRQVENLEVALKINDEFFLKKGKTIDLLDTIQAGTLFYRALDDFFKSIQSQIISTSDGKLTVTDLQNKNRVVYQWKTNALYLAKVYRTDVLGQSLN